MSACTSCGSEARAMCANCVVSSLATLLVVDTATARILAVALFPDPFDYTLPGIDRVRDRLRTLLSPADPRITDLLKH